MTGRRRLWPPVFTGPAPLDPEQDPTFVGIGRDQEKWRFPGGIRAEWFEGPTGERVPKVQRVLFTSSGTFSKGDYPWARYAFVTCVGGGGGGAGAAATGSGQAACGGGGGGGAFAQSLLDLSDLDDDETVTVGGGGSGGAGASNGAWGGDTSFGSHVVADGGAGGGYVNATASFPSGSLTGSGGRRSNSTGDLLSGGDGGSFGVVFGATSANQVYGGAGGGSALAGGAESRRANEDALAGDGPGGGGSGAGNLESQSAKDGGDGSDGIVIIDLIG